jgi:hypothetical protein
MFRLIPLFLILLTSCCNERLIVFTEVVSYEKLASFAVCTPDPALECPDRGQRLVISWFLPDCRAGGFIQGKIRFRNLEEIDVNFPIADARGHMTYELVNQDFCRTGGFLTYQLFLVQHDETVAVSTHALWTELITVGDPR